MFSLSLTPYITLANGDGDTLDTLLHIDQVHVTAIKQGHNLRHRAITSTTFAREQIEKNRITSIKDLSSIAPNFYIPDYGSRITSSVYVRGLGARIDQPVIGLNVDNVPLMNKDNYDAMMADIERIEVLRGPQSTLYGRNTMGGVINVYTLSPLSYQGTRLSAEYSSGNSARANLSHYTKIGDQMGLSVALSYNTTDGHFENLYTGELLDWEQSMGSRIKFQWRGTNGWSVDNTISISSLDQGGYPYAYIGEDIIHNGEVAISTGQINYNDPSGYERFSLSNGTTIRHEGEKISTSIIASYQYSDDKMTLDQDFTPLSYFTLEQAKREHSVTADLVLRSKNEGKYNWLAGAFVFYKHGKMSAPVVFKKTGIEELILHHANAYGFGTYQWGEDELYLGSDFKIPAYGAALYHESTYETGRWSFVAGLRLDMESTQLNYRNHLNSYYIFTTPEGQTLPTTNVVIDSSNKLKNSFVELLPKLSATYRINSRNSLFASVSKGYKTGGFNTQIFSDILQTKLKYQMVSGLDYYEDDRMSYKPEKSWNVEIGSQFANSDHSLWGDITLFWIDCQDQQLTVFPSDGGTGRLMTNAGQTRSYGAELSLRAQPWESLSLSGTYGYTNAKFLKFDTTIDDIQVSYKGKYLPYAPQNTASLNAAYTISLNGSLLEAITLSVGAKAIGEIYWDESNQITQPLYTLLDSSIEFRHSKASLTLWGRNLSQTQYDVFFFESMGNQFVQRGQPRLFGATFSLKI